VAELTEEHEQPFVYWYNNQGNGIDADELEDKFQESYEGYYDKGLEGYAEEHFDEFWNCPENIRRFIDTSIWAHELDTSGWWSKEGYVFNNR
jgi:hypothetical protein